jgi:hypothetical protein
MKAQNTVTLPSRESINSMQVTNLLNTFSLLTAFLVQSRIADANYETKGGPQDGGVKCAVETTVINLCSRLDDILAEPHRWDMDAQNTLESTLVECYKQNTRMLSAQAAGYEEIVSPHHRLKPALVKMGNDWIAFCGDLNNIDNVIIGIGTYPEQAVRAFDELFRGGVPEHMKPWLEAQEKALLAGKPVPPFFTNEPKLKHETTQVDPSGPQQVDRPPKRRNIKPRNRRPDGADSEVGGAGGAS